VSNFDGEGYGTLDVTGATINSVNTVYAQIMAGPVTPKEFMSTARQLGIDIPARDEGCALTLGTTAVTPLEMARAFATFANRGQRPEPLTVTRVTGPGGETLIERSPNHTRVLVEDVADTVNQVLQGVITSGTARGASIGRPAAGKTGTTQNHVDAWFAGYTPDLTAVVWMGYPPDEAGNIPEMTNVRGRRVTGGSFPATIWKSFMQAALRGTKPSDFVKPRAAASPSPAVTPSCPPETVPGPAGGCEPLTPLPTPSIPEFTPAPQFTDILPPPPPPAPLPPPRPLPTLPVPTPTPTPGPTVTASPSPTPTLTPGGNKGGPNAGPNAGPNND
jgi:penicillin-binding protein 1A